MAQSYLKTSRVLEVNLRNRVSWKFVRCPHDGPATSADPTMKSKPISSIAIVGSGAIGSYYGARLALAGIDVRFLMRSDREHVRAHGITLRERDGTRRLERAAVFASTAETGPVDAVLIALKVTSNAALPALLPPLLGA